MVSVQKYFISVCYIASSVNCADFNSRHFSDTTEWFLKKDIFLRLSDQFFKPDIDLFASRLNFQIQKFVSWFPQPGAYRSDAFSLCLSHFSPYIFAPFNMISKVLNKIVEDKVSKALLIVPHWPCQTWFPMLISLLSDFPVTLPRHQDLLMLPHNNQPHPMRKSLSLVGVIVSGDVSRTKDFQKKLSRQSVHHGAPVQKSSTMQHGGAGVFGVMQGKEIRFSHLK